ncbi:MAG: DUF465 domain-containing protein [Caulobacteraceae bacterium]|nr:DUF465 domain-containing protein [Caulobacteraceae bacterium]
MDGEQPQDDEHWQTKLAIAALRQQHQDLDASIRALEDLPVRDQLQVARLKRQKLAVRDQIAILENQLTPDLIA